MDYEFQIDRLKEALKNAYNLIPDGSVDGDENVAKVLRIKALINEFKS